ncbi:MAG: heme lyase CcmF/NrfE family subunit [Deltaproteobacteria bacterium]|nr:heme lyase CcmF/NrfE family subunit [Deltaproteobacteria bacterium]
MTEVGSLTLAVGLVLAAYGTVVALAGGWQQRRDLIASAEHAAFACWGLALIATAALLHALVTHDFNVEYVAAYTSSTLPLNYIIAALWGGQKGSLLFWLLILTSITAVVLLQNRERNRDLMPYVNAVLMAIAVFFFAMLVFITPPFERLAFTPPEGRDLNPLLQNYWMQLHPPSLYLGYVGCAVPFAFAIAALITGKLGDVWIRTTRRWTLFAWFFLSLGNLFGAEWAYLVLGWGGYWAWDPVENAAFLPWLTCTAFLHSVMIQEKKNMLKVWNMVLVILTFLLTIFGTFLTRSGVISSVHSFTQSGLGPFFIGFLALSAAVSLGLLGYRLRLLKSENELDSLISRESAFLFNNLVLVGIAFAVFWGTMFPIISEAVRGVKITVGPPFFNKVNAPLGIVLLFLTGVGPLIAWRRAGWQSFRKNLLPPLLAGLASGVSLAALGMRSLWALTSFSIGVFVLAGIVFEYYRGVRARQAVAGENAAVALLHLIGKNRRRYGGYIIHVGVVMMYFAITGTAVFRQEQQITLSQGQSFELGGYTLRYDGVEQESTPHIAYLRAKVALAQDGRDIDVLKPEKRFYKKPEQPTTEVAIRSTLSGDLYLVLGGFDEDTKLVTLLAYVNPLISFLWYGGLVMALGTAVVMWPAAVPVREPRTVRLRAPEPAVVD